MSLGQPSFNLPKIGLFEKVNRGDLVQEKILDQSFLYKFALDFI